MIVNAQTFASLTPDQLRTFLDSVRANPFFVDQCKERHLDMELFIMGTVDMIRAGLMGFTVDDAFQVDLAKSTLHPMARTVPALSKIIGTKASGAYAKALIEEGLAKNASKPN